MTAENQQSVLSGCNGNAAPFPKGTSLISLCYLISLSAFIPGDKFYAEFSFQATNFISVNVVNLLLLEHSKVILELDKQQIE